MSFARDSLAFRMAAAIGATLLIVQAINIALIVGERRLAFAFAQEAAAIDQYVARAADVVAGQGATPLLAGPPGALQLFSISDRPAGERMSRAEPATTLQREFHRRIEAAGLGEELSSPSALTLVMTAGRLATLLENSGVLAELGLATPATHPDRGDEDYRLLILSAQLPDGRWLNSVLRASNRGSDLGWRIVGATALLIATSLAVTLLLAQRIAQPFAALATVSDELRRGAEVPPLREHGPADVRRTIAAFNALNESRSRLIDLQRRMIGAIGHDLRTPLTTLRLRAERVTEAENRERMIAVIDEAQQTIDSVTAFVREGVTPEELRLVDVAALVDALCADYRDLGSDVTFGSEDLKLPLRIRSAQLTRAVRNLIENAVKYGARARVSIALDRDGAAIVVDDDGPGVPEDERERVFEPFVRLEDSRNRETGGIGLGLAIARMVARSHGGDVVLGVRPGGGGRATLRLPR